MKIQLLGFLPGIILLTGLFYILDKEGRIIFLTILGSILIVSISLLGFAWGMTGFVK